MLEGITILNQEMIMASPDWLGYFIIACIILAVVCFVVCLTTKNIIIELVCGILIVLALLCLMLIGPLVPNVETGQYKYEVIIDKSVSFEDIYEKYDVIEQRGEI